MLVMWAHISQCLLINYHSLWCTCGPNAAYQFPAVHRLKIAGPRIQEGSACIIEFLVQGN